MQKGSAHNSPYNVERLLIVLVMDILSKWIDVKVEQGNCYILLKFQPLNFGYLCHSSSASVA